jgi:uncharacterized protein
MSGGPLPSFTAEMAAQEARLAWEWHDDGGHWFHSCGNENCEFDERGLIGLRVASINDPPDTMKDRTYHRPLGRRPDEHPGPSDLGL